MPGLYSLAAHPALHAVHAGLRDGETVFAFLDDVYIVASPERVRELYAAVEEALWTHACVQLNRATTRIWNAASAEPADIRDLQPAGGVVRRHLHVPVVGRRGPAPRDLAR